MKTITYPTREAWLADRPSRIGASEAPGILGEGYSGESAFATYEKKINPTLDELVDATLAERLKIGTKMEPVIRDLFYEETGLDVFTQAEQVVCVSDERPHVSATLDGAVFEVGGGRGVWEAKNVGEYVASDWDDNSVPLRVQIQTQDQMYVTGYQFAYVAALLGGNRFVFRRIERNQRFIDAMLPVLDDFWDHVQRRDPPPADNTEATSKALKRLYGNDNGEEILLPPEAAEWDENLKAAKSVIKAATAAKREAENKLKAAIAGATFGRLPDGSLYSWKTSERNDPPREAKTIEIRTLRRMAK